MSNGENRAKKEDWVFEHSELILENHDEYPDNDKKFYTEDARKAIRDHNRDIDNKNVDSNSFNSPDTKLFINNETSDFLALMKIKKRYKMCPLVLYHIIQWRAAKKKSAGTSKPGFTVGELLDFCQEKVKTHDTIEDYLDLLEQAGLITRKQVGNVNSIELTSETLGPVFERYSQTNAESITIRPFESTPADRFDIGIGTPSVHTARELFHDEVHAGKKLLAFSSVLVACYLVMLTQGYPLVEKAGTHYLLTMMILVGGFAVGVGLLRQWAASMGLHRPMSY